jgi:MYXO-CTERM domain-containing protein
MRKILAITVVIVLSTANAFAGRPTPIPLTSIPTLSEWGVFGAVAVLGLVGVFFLARRRKHGCCD